MKRYTTSAQKTVDMPVEDIVGRLKKHFETKEQLQFAETNNAHILKAKLNDGSTFVIAGFNKAKGKTLAMIDHENVPADVSRSALQTKWRNLLDELF